MGVPQDWDVIYENCPYSRNQRSPSPSSVQITTMSQQHLYRRQPPPYPGHSKQVFSDQPGFRQSYSGSDTSTDMSLSSTENLSTWQRQDPQGEENQCPQYQQLDDNSLSIIARLQAASPAMISSPRGSSERLSSPMYPSSSPSFCSSAAHSQSNSATSSSSSGAEEVANINGSARQHLTVPVQWQSHGLPPPQSGLYYPRSLTPTYHHPHPYVNWVPGEGRVCEQSPRTAQVPSFVPYLPPPPEYPGHKGGERRENGDSCERAKGKVHGRSQPDLTRLTLDGGVSGGVSKSSTVVHRDNVLGQSRSYATSDLLFSALTSGSSWSSSQSNVDQMVEMLHEENSRLQEELVLCYRKISKLQKLEQEIQQVHQSYVSLVRSTDKRERLEGAIKNKLQEEVKKLQSQNEDLKVQMQHAEAAKKQGSRLESRDTQDDTENAVALRQLLNEKDTKLQQLVTEVVRWEQRYGQLQAAQHRDQQTGNKPVAHTCLAERAKDTGDEDTAAHIHKTKSSEELCMSNRRVAELEAEVKWLQTQLIHGDDASRIHKHASLSDLPQGGSTSCPSPPYSYPHTSPSSPSSHGSSTCPLCPAGCGSGESSSNCGRHVPTGNTNASETAGKTCLDGSDRACPQLIVNPGEGKPQVQLWQV